MNPEEPQGAGGISRRRMLKRVGAGVAVAWTAPILTSVRVPAYAQTTPTSCRLSAPEMTGAKERPNPVASPGTGSATFTRRRGAEPFAQPVTDARGRCVGVQGQQRRHLAAADVRDVHAGARA